MSFPTHFVAGLIIGKLTGNYLVAITGSCLIDLDHLISYFRNKILFNVNKLYQVVISQKDLYGDQRNFLHNLFSCLLISIVFLIFTPPIAITFFLAYASHLLLDIFDKADFFPFYPNKKINWHGPVAFFSWQELILTTFLFIIFLVI